jgi:hypothetical protein
MKIKVIKIFKIFTSHEIFYVVQWRRKRKVEYGVGPRVIRNVYKNFSREYWKENNLEKQALYG